MAIDDNGGQVNKDWRMLFDTRQQKEIAFCIIYAKAFAHGTDGHNVKMIIAKMADLLDACMLDSHALAREIDYDLVAS